MKNVLIAVIDMQNGFMNEYTDDLDTKIADFLDQLPNEAVEIVGTRYVNHPQTACFLFEGWKDCMDGSYASEFLASLKPYMSHIFDKDKYSCWNQEFRQYVSDHKIEKIYFLGVNTGCCVLHSAFDCYNDVVDCSVICDLCGSTSGPEEHDAALVVLKSCITADRVITTDQALQEINDIRSRRND